MYTYFWKFLKKEPSWGKSGLYWKIPDYLNGTQNLGGVKIWNELDCV
jgi:hypothetical protein